MSFFRVETRSKIFRILLIKYIGVVYRRMSIYLLKFSGMMEKIFVKYGMYMIKKCELKEISMAMRRYGLRYGGMVINDLFFESVLSVLNILIVIRIVSESVDVFILFVLK